MNNGSINRRVALGLGVAGVTAAMLPRVAVAEDANEFHVGIIASLTGAFATATKDTMDGLDAWQKTRGIPGRKVVFDTLDDETNPVNATNAFRRLAGNPAIKLIYLMISSNSALAVKSFASEFKVPIISGGGADALGIPPDPWLFKVVPSNHDWIRAVAEYVKRKGYKKIAIIYSTDVYGQSDLANIRKLAPEYGFELVAQEAFDVNDTNFNPQLTHLRAAKPDLIYSSASGRASILFYKQFKQLGITSPLIVTGAAISKSFFDAIGGADKANGLMSTLQLGTFGEKVGGDSAKLYTQLTHALGHPPAYFNTFGYDVGLITEAVVPKSDGTRQGVRDALEALSNLPALNGPVSYSATDHTGQDYRSIGIGSLADGVATLAE